MKKQILKYTFLAISALFIFACGNDAPPPEETNTAMVSTGIPEIDNITRQIINNPNDPALYAARAKAFYDNEGYDNAIYDMRDAMKIDSTNAEYHHLLADIYLDYYQSRMALKTMERAAFLHPERIPTLLKLCEFQHILKQYDASIQTIARVMKIDPQNADGFFMLGLNHVALGNKKAAIQNLQRSVDIDPDQTDAWVLLGKIFEEDKHPLAAQYYENAIQSAPSSIDALQSQALYLHNNDQLDKALALYKRINQIDRQYSDAWFNMGIIYMEKDSLDQAYNHFNIAVNTDPQFVKAYYYRGLASEGKGKLNAAKADYEQALNFQPDYEKAQESLSRVNTALTKK